jgi:hypothetical protein
MQECNKARADALGPIVDTLATQHNRENGFAFIYAFLNPKDLQPFYVGSAIDPVRRLYSHVMQPTTKASRRVAQQIAETGEYPIIKILERVDHTIRNEREKHWIRQMLAQGIKLLNDKIAGHGEHRNRHTKEEEKLRVALHAYKLQHELTYSQLSLAVGLTSNAETMHRFLVRRRSLHPKTFRKIEAFLNGVSRG